MEADVALHSHENWAAAGEQRPDKIQYVYSNRRKEREAKSARKASRLQQIKPSRSYDNDIEGLAQKEQGPSSIQRAPAPKSRDDSGMRYGEQRSSRQQGRSREHGFSGIPTPKSSPCPARNNPPQSPSGGSEVSGKAKDKIRYTPRERRKNYSGESSKAVAKQDSLPEGAGTASSQDQQQKRPKTAKSVEEKAPTRSDISPSQSIVLEVKHGPSICYKPSQTMLSDSSELDSRGEVKYPAKSPSTEISTTHPFPSDQNLHGADFSGGSRPPGQNPVTCPDDRPLPTLLKAQQALSNLDGRGFRNVSEFSQRKHGIKHDDIVVGPAAHRQRSLSERPSDLSPFDSIPTSMSDDAAFRSRSLTCQQKAGVRHDDIVVGPNAKKPKAIVPEHKDNYPKATSPGLPPIPILPPKAVRGEESSLGVRNFDLSPSESSFVDRREFESKLTSLRDGTRSASTTLERESRIPKPKDKLTDQKPRGSSPGSGIPVFRHGRVAEKPTQYENTTSGVAPLMTPPGANRSQLRSPVCLDDENKTDRSYGSVDRAKWRPKPPKSGLYRMRRGAKREANVSTESGYATDQMHSCDSNESKVSPQHTSDMAERFHRLSGSCNDIDKDLEEMLIHSRPAYAAGKKQKSVSSINSENTAPSKSKIKSKSRSSAKQHGSSSSEKRSKQNMLSNIPVVLGHDDPDPSPSYLHQPSSSGSQPRVPFQDPSNPPITSQPSPPSSDKGLGLEQDSSLSTQYPSESQTSYTPSSTPLSSTSTSTSPSSHTVPSVAHAEPHIVTTASSSSTSSAATTTATFKPRLHRSEEHLVGPAKLSVFHSNDNVTHQHQHQHHTDTASEISCSTTCSDATSHANSSDATSKSHPQRQKNQSRKLDCLATPKRSATPAKGRSVSMLRKETERSVAIVRRGSDRAIPVSRHDPSVHDLKAATSLKELCQSMASLLNIDNEKAAEMLSTSLSKRRDLVEGLDADAILDYLTHHGVLDPSVLVNLEKQNGGDRPSSAQRNSAILRHVEEHGDTAVALFINALRQSGQLHLANSLDTEQRIKPMAGEGYLDKPRHKGEIVVRLSVEALKILAPREPPMEKNVNLQLLTSAYGNHNIDWGDSDEDQIKPKSCWCFCVSRKRRTRSSSKKAKSKNVYEDTHYNQQQQQQSQRMPFTSQPSSHLQQGFLNPCDDDVIRSQPFEFPEQNPSGTNNFNGSKSCASYVSPPVHPSPTASPIKEKKKKAKSKTKSSGKQQQQHVPTTAEDSNSFPYVPDQAIIHPHPKPQDKSTDRSKEKSKQKKKDSKPIPKDLSLSKSSDKKRTKDAAEGIFMEYDSHLELVKLRACHDELASPTRQSGPMGIMVEQWKSSGKHFLIKSDLLCRAIVDEFLTDIIKYFEQERGTLVLDVVSEATSVTVFNICMTKNQVAKLDKDHVDGFLLEKLQEVCMSRLDISKFDIRGVRFCTEVDRTQLKSVLSELS